MVQIDRYSFFISRTRIVLISTAVLLFGALVYFIDPVSISTDVVVDPDCPFKGFRFEGVTNDDMTFLINTDCAHYNDPDFREFSVKRAKVTLNDEETVHEIFTPSADVFLDQYRMEMSNPIVSGFGGDITMLTDAITAIFDGPIILRGGETIFTFGSGSGCAGKLHLMVQAAGRRSTRTEFIEFSDGVRVEYERVDPARFGGIDREAEVEPKMACLDEIRLR